MKKSSEQGLNWWSIDDIVMNESISAILMKCMICWIVGTYSIIQEVLVQFRLLYDRIIDFDVDIFHLGGEFHKLFNLLGWCLFRKLFLFVHTHCLDQLFIVQEILIEFFYVMFNIGSECIHEIFKIVIISFLFFLFSLYLHLLWTFFFRLSLNDFHQLFKFDFVIVEIFAHQIHFIVETINYILFFTLSHHEVR